MRPPFKYALIWVFALILLCQVMPLTFRFEAKANNVQVLQQKKVSKQRELQRIKRIKQQIILKEKFVTSNIIHNQQRLDTSRASLEVQEHLLVKTREQLKTLEKDLDVALAEQQKLSLVVGKRLRNLYMGERMSLLHMMLDAGDISTILDRLYYKQRIFSRDKTLVANYILKTQLLEEKKDALAKQKERLASTIRSIQIYQGQLQEAMVVDRMLVQKLKTSRAAYEMAEDQLERESYDIERQILSAAGRMGQIIGSTGRFAAPIVAAVTSGFGYRVHPIYRSRRLHTGIDFGARYGSAIRAADGGMVIHAGWRGGYGKVVILNHGTQAGRNLTTLYAHMSGTAVSVGQRISKGQVVGYVGSTGFSTGPHLHFEVRENGRPVNPLAYLR